MTPSVATPSKKRPFIAGNWKMHMTGPEARDLAAAIVKAAESLKEAQIVILPPFTALSETAKVIAGTAVALGAQNLFWEDKGAYSGEISGPMIAAAGCRYVMIGHSERRQYFGETDETVSKRIAAAFRAGLLLIVCIGETLAERESGKTWDILNAQIEGGLAGVEAESFSRLVIAYEPIWAIGTGRTATPAQAEEAHAAIRGRLEERYGKTAADYAIVLYGGSVKPANAYALFRERDIDGFLVGGASLEASSFAEIAREAIRAYKEVM
jgi:triosephosphate isomerase